MIDDTHRQFLESLDFGEVYERALSFAHHELKRRGFPQDPDLIEEVVNLACERLYSPEYRVWDEIPPSLDGLMAYLGKRVDDVVKMKSRERQRKHQHQRSDNNLEEHEHPCSPSATAHELIELNRLADAWLDAATEHSTEVGEVVLEYLSDRTKLADQASALNLPASRVAELRRTAKRLFEDVAQREATR